MIRDIYTVETTDKHIEGICDGSQLRRLRAMRERSATDTRPSPNYDNELRNTFTADDRLNTLSGETAICGDCLKQSELSGLLLARIAESLGDAPVTLTRLAKDKHPSVRIAVADNPNTPRDTLRSLVNDAHPDVRYALAENHNCAFVLMRLVDDENPYVAARARKTMRRLSGDTLISIDFSVIENANRNRLSK